MSTYNSIGIILKTLLLICFLAPAEHLISCDNSNNSCVEAEQLNVPNLNEQYCFDACNTNGQSGPYKESSVGCEASPFQTVWYHISSPSSKTKLTVSVSAPSLSSPLISIYKGTCNALDHIECNQGYSNKVAIKNLNLDLDSEYLIAISTADGSVGAFELCVTLDEDTNICNTNSNLEIISTSEGSPLWGPYQSGEEVEICYTVDGYEKLQCNYLHAILPLLGNGWDPSSLDAEGKPLKVTKSLITQGYTNFTTANPVCEGDAAGEWRWHPAGSVQYNLNSDNPLGLKNRDEVPAAWIFVNAFDPSCLNFNDSCCTNPDEDPSLGYGDDDYPICWMGPAKTWTICFALTTALSPSKANHDCTIGMKTLADGEIGVYPNNACNADMISYINASVAVCTPPLISLSHNSISTCTEMNFSIELNSDNLETNFYWSIVGKNEINIVGDEKIIEHSFREAGTYNIEVYGSNGCKSLPALLEIEVLEELELELIQEPTIVCPGDEVLFTAEVAGVTDLASINYSWNGDTNAGSSLTARDIDSVYDLTVAVGDCQVEETIKIKHYDISTAEIWNTEAVCAGDLAELRINLSGTAPWTIIMEDENGLEIEIETSSPEYIEEVMVEEAQSYLLHSAIDGNGCVMNVLGEWKLSTLTEMELRAGQDTYLDCMSGQVQLNGETNIEPERLQVLWTNDQEHPIENPNSLSPIVTTAGSYMLNVTDLETGCSVSDIIEVKEHNKDMNLELSNPHKVQLEIGESLFLEAHVDLELHEVATVLWQHDGTIECETCMSSMAYPEKDVTYSIMVIDINGCIESTSVQVTIRAEEELEEIYIPNTFDPNSFGVNSTFGLFGKVAIIDEFIISDRWGTEILSLQDVPPADHASLWDGTIDGAPLDPGVFVYMIRYTLPDGVSEMKIGNLTILK